MPGTAPLCGWAQYRLQVEDLDLVEADRVRPVGRAGREHSAQRIAGVVARVHTENIAVGAIEPGDDDHAVAGGEAVERLGDVGVKGEPGVGRTLVALFRRRCRVGQIRFDAADLNWRKSS